MSFTNIKYIIPEAAKQHQVEPQFIKYKVITAWEKVAPGFFGSVTEFAKAIEFKKGALTIACLSKELAYQIRLLAKQILKAINEFLNHNFVYNLVIEV